MAGDIRVGIECDHALDAVEPPLRRPVFLEVDVRVIVGPVYRAKKPNQFAEFSLVGVAGWFWRTILVSPALEKAFGGLGILLTLIELFITIAPGKFMTVSGS